ncbi:hypothetical protein BDD43_4436 [Mucilaginibacter gracilis]|uniref:Uncharacterized protein n=1 Tax=Mucilaginibacter gracilis TaxID=423350 RepID=A0A495J721_9SPHI|nr:hypothetical protein [Mucilaginibacter gracilis]RKR84208.1 hypothetical protein BDD43_4436 [Mucilaginibacter gracilis]
MYEIFIEFLDQIFWEGYASQLAAENPQEFQNAYKDFYDNYNA